MARSIEEKGAAVKGRRIPDQDLGLPDFSMDDSDSDSETEESSVFFCYSEVSEDKEIVLNNSENPSVDKDGCFPLANISSDRLCVSMQPTSGTTECDISTHENDDSGLRLSHSSFENHSPDRGQSTCVNLDITAMIAYVSATANGGANFSFQDKFLNEQAACERRNPVKKTLHEYFKGKSIKVFQYLVL